MENKNDRRNSSKFYRGECLGWPHTSYGAIPAVQGRIGYLNTLLWNFFFYPILRFILLFVLCPKVDFLSELGSLLKPGTLILYGIWSDEGGSARYSYKDLFVRNPDLF